jgi:hypothetical protein
MTDRLLIFTRYPTSGRSKTRLIPALGAHGAACLHRRMAERTLATARQAASRLPLALEVHFTGGAREELASWLGPDPIYVAQQGADLGERLIAAIGRHKGSAGRMVVIGTDCPQLEVRHLEQAFSALHTDPLVLGPASDGGYYLLGLSADGIRRALPELLRDINWGSERVLAQTMATAERLQLRVQLLPELDDIDRPQDLTPERLAGIDIDHDA